jgi:hypothetical protein
MLKKSASIVLASLRGTVKREVSNVKRGSAAELRPCLEQGASQGEEAVLADSGREGEISAGVGRVRSLAFLSILQVLLVQSVTSTSAVLFVSLFDGYDLKRDTIHEIRSS